MAVSIPQLDVYYIEFAEDASKKRIDWKKLGKKVGQVAVGAVPALFVPGIGWVNSSFWKMGLSLTPDIVVGLKRLIDENKFYVINSQKELNKFENAYNNEWVINNKALKQKQYYIRHPKKMKSNVLIEAKSFYKYIEEEQKTELLEFIESHCVAKSIQIDRTEIVGYSGNAKGNIKGADAQGNISFGNKKGNYLSLSNPNNNTLKPEKRSVYMWLDKSIISSISMMSEGAVLESTYESDFTFGLSAGEAKTIGFKYA